MLIITYALNFILMILLPLLLGWFLARRYGLAWRLFIVGGLTFILSQVFHIPFNIGLTTAFKQGLLPSVPPAWSLPFNAVVLGLSAALFEEFARYIVLRTTLKDARSWKKALMFGAGHGGIEAILLGLLAGMTYINMIVLRQNPALLNSLSVEQLQLAQQQISSFWAAPWYMSMLGAVERVFAIIFHLSAAVLVMQVFLRQQRRWLAFAIGWHWLLDGLSVYVVGRWGALATEGVLAVLTLVSLGIILSLRTPDPRPQAPPPAEPAFDLPSDAPAPLSADMIERSRYSE